MRSYRWDELDSADDDSHGVNSIPGKALMRFAEVWTGSVPSSFVGGAPHEEEEECEADCL